MSEWIKTADKMPNDLNDVLFYALNNIWIGYYDADINCYVCDQYGRTTFEPELVAHWQPLPKAPEVD